MAKEYLIGFGGDCYNPDWKFDRRVHDWRNYIGENTQKMWNSFTNEQKIALATDAESFADREEWD